MHFIISFTPIKIQNISIILESSLRPTPDQLLTIPSRGNHCFYLFPHRFIWSVPELPCKWNHRMSIFLCPVPGAQGIFGVHPCCSIH